MFTLFCPPACQVPNQYCKLFWEMLYFESCKLDACFLTTKLLFVAMYLLNTSYPSLYIISCGVYQPNTYSRACFQMLARSRAVFVREYNNKLFNWLVAFSLIMVVIGRFVIKLLVLEVVAWVMFIFLETYTRLFWSSDSLYYNPVQHIIVSSWETIVYNPVLDLDKLDILFPHKCTTYTQIYV